MADEYRIAADGADGLLQIAYIIADRKQVKPLASGAAAVSAQTHGAGAKTLFGEIGQKVLGPAPGPGKSTVHEQQRSRAAALRRAGLDDFQLFCVFRAGGRVHRLPGAYAGTTMPRCTAARAPIASYQRLTLGKSRSSVLCHSCRATHG